MMPKINFITTHAKTDELNKIKSQIEKKNCFKCINCKKH